MTWFWIEEFNHGPGQDNPLLFSIFSEQIGGFECFFDDFTIYYWGLEPGEYTPPSIETSYKLCTVEPR